MKIACCGTHGVGKSTLTYQLADYFKRNRKNVYVVHERVRASPFKINNDMSEETAIWAFTTQVAKELEYSCRGYEVIICDRSCYDTFIYAEFFGLKDYPIDNFKEASENWLETYDYFFWVRPDMQPLEDGIRDTGDFFRLGIDRSFEELFDCLNKDYYQVVTTSQILNKEVDFGILRNF